MARSKVQNLDIKHACEPNLHASPNFTPRSNRFLTTTTMAKRKREETPEEDSEEEAGEEYEISTTGNAS